jgi:hypothetical protein
MSNVVNSTDSPLRASSNELGESKPAASGDEA